jgi:hypothetical protein
MQFLMVVDNAEIAEFVSRNGVAKLFVDLEYMGKDERQKGLDTWKSRQGPEDVTRIREAAPDAHLLVRVNPLHDGSKAEIDDALFRGANTIMLPMFHTCDELARFYDLLGGRAEALPLFETKASLDNLLDMTETLPLTQLHIGLNDLHLDAQLDFMFEPFANGMLEGPTAILRDKNIKFGIGGIARAREGIISPDFLLGEHVRLGSTGAILSRTFHRSSTTLGDLQEKMDFYAETEKLQAIYAQFLTRDAIQLEQNRVETARRIRDVARLIGLKKGA